MLCRRLRVDMAYLVGLNKLRFLHLINMSSKAIGDGTLSDNTLRDEDNLIRQ